MEDVVTAAYAAAVDDGVGRPQFKAAPLDSNELSNYYLLKLT
jgi:hypothetical protein